MTVLAASQKQTDAPQHVFRITLGLKDRQPTDWSGQVEVNGGTAVAITGWRFEENDTVDGTSGWKCRTHPHIARGERNPLQLASGELPYRPKQEPWPNGVTLTVQGETPTLTITLKAGQLAFKAEDVPLGEAKTYLDGQVQIERMPETSIVRPAAPPKAEDPVQDDYPAFWVRYKTGKQYLAWVAFRQQKDRVLLVERDGPDSTWSEPKEVAGPGDHFRVALASTHGDTLWIVWSSQREHNWDLFARPYTDGKLGEELRLTHDNGPDIWHTMTTDQRGRAWTLSVGRNPKPT
jgi:hypothetical protein